jgi:hypothetical protein
LAGLLSVLGNGAQGYLQGKRMKDEDDERKQERARRDEEYQYQKGLRDTAQALDTDIGSAMADRSVETVDQPASPNADLSMAAGAPPAYKVGDATYGDETQARAALQGVNSRAAKYQRAAAAAATHGAAGVDKAQLYDAFAKRALDEGTDKILGVIQQSAPSVEQVKQAGGTVAGAIGQDAADVFNQTGAHWKVAPDTVVQHFLDKDAAGREFVNQRVLGKDGKPVVDNVAHAGLMLQDYKTRLEAQRADTSAYQSGQQIAQAGARDAETVRSHKATEAETAADHRAQRGIAAGTLALAQAKDKREATLFKNQTPEGQIEQLEAAIGPMTADDKKAYRKKFLGIGVNKGNDDALIADLTKKWSENNPTAGAPDVAKFRAGLQDSFAQVGSNRQVESALKAEFTKNPFGSTGYAATYNDAKSQLNLTDQQLAQLGYPPPAGPARPAARGTALPAEPAKMVWVGNTHQENPAWTAWNSRYGDATRSSAAAEAARLTRGYERTRD